VSATLLRCDDRRTLGDALETARTSGEAIAFVPTMGALHEGHLALVRRATELAPQVVVSIFVNPTQFDRASDLAAYPRTLESDLELLATLAADADARIIAYVPDVEDVYPDGPDRTLHVPDVTDHLCGASRPGHFDGVATVVDALLRAVRPTVLLMGRKDHQQLVVVRHLIAQQGHDIELEAVPIVRAADGVAVSSRNTLLDAAARELARRVPRALAAGVIAARNARASGTALRPSDVRAAAEATLSGDGLRDGLRIDYLETVDPDRIVPVADPVADPVASPIARPVEAADAAAEGDPATPSSEGLLLAVAVHVPSDGGRSSVRLIDNVLLGDVEDEQRLLDALAGAVDPRAQGLER
jgi:pantoate--beta-alanine ligase